MIRLNPVTEPTWIDLGHGVRVLVEPLGSMIIAEALSHPDVSDLPEDTHRDVRFAAVVRVVARLSIREWEGVGDAEGNPAPVAPEYVDALMAHFPIHRAFSAAYVAKGFALASEKKG